MQMKGRNIKVGSVNIVSEVFLTLEKVDKFQDQQEKFSFLLDKLLHILGAVVKYLHYDM